MVLVQNAEDRRNMANIRLCPARHQTGPYGLVQLHRRCKGNRSWGIMRAQPCWKEEKNTRPWGRKIIIKEEMEEEDIMHRATQ